MMEHVITKFSFSLQIFLIILIASKSIEVILIGRLIDGLTMGGMYVCVALYISEISDKRLKLKDRLTALKN